MMIEIFNEFQSLTVKGDDVYGHWPRWEVPRHRANEKVYQRDLQDCHQKVAVKLHDWGWTTGVHMPK
jgi:hypothetical protein